MSLYDTYRENVFKRTSNGQYGNWFPTASQVKSHGYTSKRPQSDYLQRCPKSSYQPTLTGATVNHMPTSGHRAVSYQPMYAAIHGHTPSHAPSHAHAPPYAGYHASYSGRNTYAMPDVTLLNTGHAPSIGQQAALSYRYTPHSNEYNIYDFRNQEKPPSSSYLDTPDNKPPGLIRANTFTTPANSMYWLYSTATPKVQQKNSPKPILKKRGSLVSADIKEKLPNLHKSKRVSFQL